MKTVTRRTIAAAMPMIAFGRSVSGVSAESDQSAILTQLIGEVIERGDMSNLDKLVTPDVTIAVLGITNIDEFLEASTDAFENRSSTYDKVSFLIESIAENEDWCHALVRFEGKKKAGGMETRPVFYVARFHDGLIQALYLG